MTKINNKLQFYIVVDHGGLAEEESFFSLLKRLGCTEGALLNKITQSEKYDVEFSKNKEAILALDPYDEVAFAELFKKLGFDDNKTDEFGKPDLQLQRLIKRTHARQKDGTLNLTSKVKENLIYEIDSDIQHLCVYSYEDPEDLELKKFNERLTSLWDNIEKKAYKEPMTLLNLYAVKPHSR